MDYNNNGYPCQNNQQIMLSDPNAIMLLDYICKSMQTTNGFLSELCYKNTQVSQKNSIEPDMAYAAGACLFDNGKAIVVFSKTGRLHTVLDCSFREVIYVKPNRRYKFGSYYALFIDEDPIPQIIFEADCQKPANLVVALSTAAKREINFVESPYKTGMMFKTYLARRKKDLELPFYFGWQEENSVYRFFLNCGKTHGEPLAKGLSYPYELPGPDHQLKPHESLYVAEQFATVMECVVDPTMRGVLSLWLHIATLYSLLVKWGMRFPIGFYFYCHDAYARRYLGMLFSCYGDEVISLAENAKAFQELLQWRKDQLLAIEDVPDQVRNAEMLIQSVKTGCISASQDNTAPKLCALPTVIGTAPSKLSHCEEFSLIEASSECFASDSYEQLRRHMKYLPGYFSDFAEFVSNHLESVEMTLNKAINNAFLNVESDTVLSDSTTMALGILAGVQEVIMEYYNNLAPSHQLMERLDLIVSDETLLNLNEMFQQSALYGDNYVALVSLFASLAAKKISDGNFDIYNVADSSCKVATCDPSMGIVYEDEKYYSFSREAFVTVCQDCFVPSARVQEALSQLGMLEGPRINKDAGQTRISVYDVYGKRSTKAVYKISKLRLEDPSLFI